MRNHAEKWPEIPDWTAASLHGQDIEVTSRIGLKQWLVSGNLEAWNQRSGLKGPGVGALGLVTDEVYQVRLARDRLLAVNIEAAVQPGWDAAGFALTDMNAALHVFEFSGSRIDEVLKRATTLDPQGKSPSATVAFAGITASLYYINSGTTLRVHVDRGLATHVWTWLKAQALFHP